MKKIFLIFGAICICKISKAQNQNTSPYPPPAVTPGTLAPTQSGPPYNATNPTGMPNTSYTLTPPPGFTSPASPFINNGTTITPVTPTTNITPKQFQTLLYQDPMRTPKNPKLKTAVTVDGSNGK